MLSNNIFDFEAHIMFSLCFTLQGTGLPVWEKFNFNVTAKCEYLLIYIDLLIYKLS